MSFTPRIVCQIVLIGDLIFLLAQEHQRWLFFFLSPFSFPEWTEDWIQHHLAAQTASHININPIWFSQLIFHVNRLCNMDIISHVQQVICFAFHDSRLLMETCQEAKNLRKIVTLFYLDWSWTVLISVFNIIIVVQDEGNYIWTSAIV